MNLNATLLGQMIAFGLFVWFCWKFVWPPLLAAMEERAEKIEQGLKDSEESAKKILDAEEQSKKMLAEAKKEAKKIMDNAKNQSEKIVEESKNKATEEKDRIVGSAQSEIEKEVVNAKKTLEKDFASSVMSAVKKIVAKELGILTVAVVTTPFKYEQEKRAEQARAGISKLMQSVDSCIEIDNEKIFEIFPANAQFSEGFNAVNEVISRVDLI